MEISCTDVKGRLRSAEPFSSGKDRWFVPLIAVGVEGIAPPILPKISNPAQVNWVLTHSFNVLSATFMGTLKQYFVRFVMDLPRFRGHPFTLRTASANPVRTRPA